MNPNFCEILESEYSVTAKALVGQKFRTICQVWLEAFFPNVKRNTGHWVYRGYRWHAYSFNHEVTVSGEKAFGAFQAMPIEPFYLFHEWNDNLYECTAEVWPDLRALNDDIYIFPRQLEWMFVITHEMSIGLGPYFAHAVNECGE